MQFPVSTLLALTLIAALTFACDDEGDGTSATPTAPAATATVTAPSPTPLSTPTPRPPILTTPATLEGCPIDDGALCEFAIDLQEALNADDGQFIAARLTPETHPCQGTFARTGEDIGCESDQDTSDPIVLFIGFSSDCCFSRPERFIEELTDWIAETDNGAGWRLYGVIRNAALWDDGAAILLIRGSGGDAPVLEVGANHGGPTTLASALVAGAAHGPFDLMYIRPAETLLPWP